MNIRKGIFILATVAAAAWLLWLFDDGLGAGWPYMVLRNWQEFGLSTLHGALVTNAGGFEALTNPQIYYGMSPWYLYPVYFCTELFAWTGLGAIPYHIFLAILVVYGVWSLLGKNNAALMVAALVILSPSYGRWQKMLDPNSLSVLLGFPYAAIVTSLLKKAKLQSIDIVLLLVLTAAFVPLNWTTAWFLAPFGVFLLLHPDVRRRPAMIYLALTAIAAVVFVAYSVVAKHSESFSADANVSATAPLAPHRSVLGGYTWGSYGYYEGLSTFRFFARLFVINVLGSLPLILWWAAETFVSARKAPRAWVSILPALTAILQLIAMRNYFCHHPWMAGPVVITGFVFSLALLAKDTKPRAAFESLKWPSVAAVAAFVYGFLIIAGMRANSNESLSLARLISDKVPRTETVAVVKSIDPDTAALCASISKTFDRHVIAADSLNDLPDNIPVLILTSRSAADLALVAEEDSNSGAGVMARGAAWFNKNIARREPTDKIQYASHYYLYSHNANAPASP